MKNKFFIASNLKLISRLITKLLAANFLCSTFIEFVFVLLEMNSIFAMTISFSRKYTLLYNWIWRIKTYLLLFIYYFGINTWYLFHVTFKTETSIVPLGETWKFFIFSSTYRKVRISSRITITILEYVSSFEKS